MLLRRVKTWIQNRGWDEHSQPQTMYMRDSQFYQYCESTQEDININSMTKWGFQLKRQKKIIHAMLTKYAICVWCHVMLYSHVKYYNREHGMSCIMARNKSMKVIQHTTSISIHHVICLCSFVSRGISFFFFRSNLSKICEIKKWYHMIDDPTKFFLFSLTFLWKTNESQHRPRSLSQQSLKTIDKARCRFLVVGRFSRYSHIICAIRYYQQQQKKNTTS